MSVLALFLFVMLAWALGGLWPDALGLSANGPDPWLMLVVYLALRGRGYMAVGWAITIGLLRDSLSLDPLGTHAFVLGMVAFLFCEGHRQRTPVEGASRLLATFGATVAAGALYVVRTLPMGGDAATFQDLLAAFPTALWTTLLAAGTFPVFDSLHLFDELVGRRRGLPT